jgi:Cysteine-rich CPXCG
VEDWEGGGDDLFEVICPYCGEAIQISVDPDVRGTYVQDCEVCCHPWQVTVHGAGRRRRVDLRRADGSE